MGKHKNKFHQSRAIRLMFLGLIVLVLLMRELMSDSDVALFNPRGFIALEQFNLMILSAAILLVIGIPALFFFYYFAWKYRETNTKAAYDPHPRHGKGFVFSIWAIPIVFAIVLTIIMWPATHRLEPRKPIAADAKPMTVKVVAMRWKWLFIYPEQNIATVNFVQVPTGTPVQFDLTADDVPMSSFWVPHLGGMLYAMTGHVNRLNLVADTAGDYPGSTAEINGAGFAGMKFTARASSQEDFDRWVSAVKVSSDPLDSKAYEDLLVPSESNPSVYYNLAETGLYDKVLMKYAASHDHAETESPTGHSPKDQDHMKMEGRPMDHSQMEHE